MTAATTPTLPADLDAGLRRLRLGAVSGSPEIDRKDPDAKDDIVTSNQLNLPIDRPVLVHLSSQDVIHSFFVPAFRMKHDVLPGRYEARLTAAGQTLVMILGGLDLSIPGFIVGGAILTSQLCGVDGWSLGPALVVIIVLAAILGAFSGYICHRYT